MRSMVDRAPMHAIMLIMIENWEWAGDEHNIMFYLAYPYTLHRLLLYRVGQ